MIQSGYTKLFGSIVASTIWREDDKTRLVWITLLALSDRDGYVAGSLPGLADLARVSIEDCEKAIVKLQQPDKYSRSSEHDGRRIQAIEGGWLILNRAKYRDLVPDDHRREVDRLRQQRHRKKQKGDDVTVSRVTWCDSHETSRKKEKEKKKEKKNPSSEQNSCSDQATPPTTKQPSQEACRFAELLKSEIQCNKADYRITPAQERKWAVTAQKMLDIDKRDPQEVADLIRWAQHDEFWMANVLSMDTLREKFDQLQLKRGRSNGRGKVNGKIQPMTGSEIVRLQQEGKDFAEILRLQRERSGVSEHRN